MTPESHQSSQPPVTLADLSQRTRIELLGRDRATLLHNLCTNDIRSLKPGQGCEMFVTNVQGKLLGHGYVFCHPESLVFDTTAGQAESLLRHFDRYTIREDVQPYDRSTQWAELLLAGAGAEPVLSRLVGEPMPQGRLAHGSAQLAGRDVILRRVDWVIPVGFLIQCDLAHRAAVCEAIDEAGAMRWTDADFDAARIEAGTPLYGQDMTEANLPQEVARDALAIHFAKGCYLGQETVARIDALGHVNKTLCGVRFFGDQVPPIGMELQSEEKIVGQVTSAARSPRLGAPLALAYLRRGHNQPGARLVSLIGESEVVALPLG